MVIRCFDCMSQYEQEYGICPYCGRDMYVREDSFLERNCLMLSGSNLAGRYIVGKVIGYGSFGVTYIGWDNILQQRVAIMEYLPRKFNMFFSRTLGQTSITVRGMYQEFQNGMSEFANKAKCMAKLQNKKGAVYVYDIFEANNTAYIILEYLIGETLNCFLGQNKQISVNIAIEMLTPIIEFLESMHNNGYIHGEIAPDCIVLTQDEEIKVIDYVPLNNATGIHQKELERHDFIMPNGLGLSNTQYLGGRVTEITSSNGTILKSGFSPIEQYHKSHIDSHMVCDSEENHHSDLGPHTDVYAIAAVLYRMVTGIAPPDALYRINFNKKDNLIPPSKCCKIKRSKENAILNAMNFYHGNRTPTARVFLTQLTSIFPVMRI